MKIRGVLQLYENVLNEYTKSSFGFEMVTDADYPGDENFMLRNFLYTIMNFIRYDKPTLGMIPSYHAKENIPSNAVVSDDINKLDIARLRAIITEVVHSTTIQLENYETTLFYWALIDFMRMKNAFIQGGTGIEFFAPYDAGEIFAMTEIPQDIFLSIGMHILHGDIRPKSVCPFCIHEGNCAKCSYGNKHGICDTENSTYWKSKLKTKKTLQREDIGMFYCYALEGIIRSLYISHFARVI